MERAVLTISPVHSEDWRTEIISFLQGNYLSDDEAYNKRMEARTRPYVIIEGELYKHGVCSPLLKCLSRAEGIELMKDAGAQISNVETILFELLKGSKNPYFKPVQALIK